jgi:short-subunit dehydrogenase
MRLRNRTLWLIGASSGIGAALAPLLASEGAVLALSARREEELECVAATCPGDRRPLVKPLDVTDKAQIDRVYHELVDTWGKVDVLFYNAAAAGLYRTKDFDADEALLQVDVSFLGLVRAVGAVLPDMRERGNGDIVGMASIAGYAGMPRSAGYGAAKSAAINLLQSLRLDFRADGIGVVTVNPGFVKTRRTEGNQFPMPFLLTPEQAATAIVKGLLAGDEEIHFPKRLSWPAKLFTGLPRPVYEWLVRTFMLGAVRRRP